MNSEQMRIELEIFVNDGLREGWQGWPLKGEAQASQPCDSQLNVTSWRLWHGQWSRPTRLTRRRGLFAIPA